MTRVSRTLLTSVLLLLATLGCLSLRAIAGEPIDEYTSAEAALAKGDYFAAQKGYVAAAKDNRGTPSEGNPNAYVGETVALHVWTPHFLAAYAAYKCAAEPNGQVPISDSVSKLKYYVENYGELVRRPGDSGPPAQAPVQAHYFLGLAYQKAGSVDLADAEFVKALDQLPALIQQGKPKMLVDIQGLPPKDKELFTDLAFLKESVETNIGGPPKLSFAALTASAPDGGTSLYLPLQVSDSGLLRAELAANVRWFRPKDSTANPSMTCNGSDVKLTSVPSYDWRAVCPIDFSIAPEAPPMQFQFVEPQSLTLQVRAGDKSADTVAVTYTVVPVNRPPSLADALAKARTAGP